MENNIAIMEDYSTIDICGETLALAANLRVAYMVQGCNGHKPYTQVFQELGEMPIEKQIEIIYVAAKVADPTLPKRIPQQKFLDYCLDNYNVKQILDNLKYITHGSLGIDDEDVDVDGEGSEGN